MLAGAKDGCMRVIYGRKLSLIYKSQFVSYLVGCGPGEEPHSLPVESRKTRPGYISAIVDLEDTRYRAAR